MRVFAAAEAQGIKDYIQYDPNTIRGLLYYTSTVFEAFDTRGEIKRSILGGGRYDNLMSQVGGDPVPAVGFAMGDLVISLLLETLGLTPKELSKTPADVIVTVFDAALQPVSMAAAAELRQAGLKVICSTEASKLPKQFKYADRIGIRAAVVIGPDEAANGQVTVKNLADGSQQTIARSTAAEEIKKLLESRRAL